MERLADALPLERAASALDRVERSRRACREDRRLCRARLPPSGVPRARPRPGALPESSTASRCCRGCARSSDEPHRAALGAPGASPAADGQAGRRSGGADRRGSGARRARAARQRRAGDRAEDRLQGRGPQRRSRHGEAVGARHRARHGSAEGSAAGRADPVGVGARRAVPAQRADRRASAGLRHGQCRRRPVQRRRRRTASSARCCCRSIPTAAPQRCASALAALCGVPPAVIITDSFGRAWRRGTAGVAIGAAGLPALLDLRGNPDLFGRTLQVSIIGFADEIAAAASLVMGQGDEAQPVVLVRGLTWSAPANPAVRARAAGGRGHVSVSSGLVVALSGGVGGAKLALGLSRVLPADELLIVANTGDDFEHLGLSISSRHRHADLCAGRPRQSGHRLGPPRRDLVVHGDDRARWAARTWFRLGDRDLALHVERTRRLAAGETPVADHRRRLPAARRRAARAADERRSRAHARAQRRAAGSTSRTISCASSAGRSCGELAFTGAADARPQPEVMAALERRQRARRGDLPVQPVHQHRADPGRARHARGDRRTAARPSSRCRRSSAAARSRDRPPR